MPTHHVGCFVMNVLWYCKLSYLQETIKLQLNILVMNNRIVEGGEFFHTPVFHKYTTPYRSINVKFSTTYIKLDSASCRERYKKINLQLLSNRGVN